MPAAAAARRGETPASGAATPKAGGLERALQSVSLRLGGMLRGKKKNVDKANRIGNGMYVLLHEIILVSP